MFQKIQIENIIKNNVLVKQSSKLDNFFSEKPLNEQTELNDGFLDSSLEHSVYKENFDNALKLFEERKKDIKH